MSEVDSDSDYEYDERELKIWKKVRHLVRSLFQQDIDRKDQLFEVLETLLKDEIGIDEVCSVYDTLEDSPSFYWHRKYSKEDLTTIGIVAEEYTKLNSGISIWPVTNCSAFKFFDFRYGLRIMCSGPSRTLYLMDNFHGQQIDIPIDGNFPNNGTSLHDHHVEFLDPEHILIFENWEDPAKSRIDLLHLDIANFGCTVLSTYEQSERIDHLIFDENCRHKFLLCNLTYPSAHARFARVENYQIVVDPRPMNISREPMYSKLVGNTLQMLRGVESEEDLSTGTFEFGEYNLNPEIEETEFKKLQEFAFGGEIFEEFSFNMSHQFVTPDAIYLLYNFKIGLSTLRLYKLDLKTPCLNLITFFHYADGYIKDLHVDENGIATICMYNFLTSEFVIHRIPTNQPDTLLNQSFFAIRRPLIHDSKKYDKVPLDLPPHLRPFGTFLKFSSKIPSTMNPVENDEPCSSSFLNCDEPVEKKPKTE